ncbi:MAG: hypothetical protein CVV47_13390 [Spirochaetae bacterium HGW-Spirochaetae-3]|nr:MAG: hypothetical protein CVV47_13390 [Spirochaetae bacterium HGW-Spirochaetae-3]
MIDGERTAAAARRRVAAVLFDMDGTLLDSEPAYYASDRDFLAGYGIDYTEELNASFTGRGAYEMMRALERMYPDSPIRALSLEERIRMKDEAYARYAPSRVKAFPAVEAFARELSRRGVGLAIASGSSPEVIELMIRGNGLDGLFAVRVSSAEVPRGKPEPDVFLEAARRLGVEPGSCLVLEDSRYGVAAARAAGMSCIALPVAGSRAMEEFGSADIVVEGGAVAFDPEAALRAFDWERRA